MALKKLAALVRREALVMAFADVFLVFTALFVVLAFVTLIRHPPPPMAAPAEVE